MSAPNNLLRFILKWITPFAALAALVLACFVYFYSPGSKRFQLTGTAGNARGMRHQLAQRFQEEIASRGLSLTLLPSQGSEQALDWVNEHQVDLALVQGGLTSAGRANVRQVATLQIEPMHLAVKKELAADVSRSLTALRGKTVDLEEVGSGTHSLGLAILQFVGLQSADGDATRGYIPLSLDRERLFAESNTSRLPDAVFLVSTLPSSTTRYLVSKHGYRLVPLPFAEALALESLEGSAAAGLAAAGDGRIVLGRVQPTIIPAFTYGIEPPVPDRPLPTLGTRLLLVAHKDVPAREAFQLVEEIYASEVGQMVHPPLDARLMDVPPEFPWHAGALLYQHRNAPLLSGAVMDSAHKGFAIFAAAASGLFVLWQWLKMHRTVTRSRGFKEHMAQVTRIEERARATECHGPLPLDELLIIRERVGQLKTQALDEFAAADHADKDLLFGFLLQVHDVRDYLTRLIHQREESASKASESLAAADSVATSHL
jgi:TRAP-type uncharacterized transport system substrate-binding protein